MPQPVRHRAVLLAGGRGTRLHPLTVTVSKQLLAVYDKPMVYYPLTTLLLAGAREILVIADPAHEQGYRDLLADGAQWGIRIRYAAQAEPKGIAEALLIADEFIADSPAILMLGDNVLYGRFDFLRAAVREAGDHATVFAYHVDDPTGYGVVEIADDGRVLSIEEKPQQPRSHWAVPGLYLYPPGAAAEARMLAPSPRGELEITDLHRRYLEQGRLRARRMGRGTAWFDTGTVQDLLEASSFIEAIQRRQGLLVGSPEEVAFRLGLIDGSELQVLVDALPACSYRDYLQRVIDDQDWSGSPPSPLPPR
jgi:glucose-1-phosphate thymidylyltransferase